MKITIREATRDDSLRLEAFLKRRFETSMFMRSNLRNYSIGRSKHPYAMRYFLREKGGAIQGVGAVANNGMLMMQAVDGLADIAAYMCDALPDNMVCPEMLGDSAQVRIMRKAFDLMDAETLIDDEEPLFSLDLDNLIIPQHSAELRKPDKDDFSVLSDWYYAYAIETSLRPANEESRLLCEQAVKDEIKDDTARLLFVDGKPVAKTGFNATMPDTVQIGGVYTPPELRGRGYGRQAVALHLKEARSYGVKHAILFSANDHASRAYRAIGFEQVGTYTITVFTKDT